MTVFIELTDERGRTARAEIYKNGLVRPRTKKKAAIVCWSLVVAPCWAYVARTRAVSLSSACCLSGARIRSVRGSLTIHAPDGDWTRLARAAAHSGKAHARRAVMLLARRIDRLPPEVWMRIAGFLASMCEVVES